MKIMRYILGGRTGEAAHYNIGPSSYLIIATVLGITKRFIVDCGLEPTPFGGRGIDLALLEETLRGEKIDAVFVTHAHLDHCGFLPALEPYLADHCRVWATTTTAALLPHVYADTLTQSTRKSGVLGALPFTYWETLDSINRIKIVSKPGVLNLGKGFDVLVWPAGHINGAASFIFRFTEGSVVRKVACLGDYSVHHQILVAGAPLPPPEWLLDGPNDVIASMDCTNGAEDLPPWKQVLDEMTDYSDRVVEMGGKAIYVTFSMVRWQLLIHETARRVERRGDNAVIYGDGPSAWMIADILRQNPWWGDEAFDVSQARRVGKGISRDEVIASLRGARIFTPSGMGHGPATAYELALLEDPESSFLFTGFAAPGSNARNILDAKEGEEVEIQDTSDDDGNPRKVKVRAERRQYRLTGHQLRTDAVWRTLELLGCVKPEHIAWKKGDELGNPKEWLTDATLNRIASAHVGLTHANTRALDWFESEFTGVCRTSRGDKPDDRAREI